MLALRDLSVGHGGNAIISDIDAEVQPGRFICVLGRNGAGKTTLLRTISGLLAPVSGIVELDGLSVTGMSAAQRARRISVMVTERAHSPGLSAADVVAIGRLPFTGWAGRLEKNDHRIVNGMLAMAGAVPFANRAYDSLSDGERQRVLLARALAQGGALMVLDEITAFLDLPGRVDAMALLKRHAAATGAIVLLSTHDLDLALELAEEIWLADGTGSMARGSPTALAEAGALSRAFDTEEIRFDVGLMRFRRKAQVPA